MAGSDIFLGICLAVCAGILSASFFQTTHVLFWIFLLSAALMLICGLFLKKHKPALAGLLLFFFALGFWRFDSVWREIGENELLALNGKNEEIEFIATVVEDPQKTESQLKLVVKPEAWQGKIMVLAGRYPEYRYGDKLKITGILQDPEPFNGFDYKNYLAKNGIYSVVRRPGIELAAADKGNIIYSGIIRLKNKLSGNLHRNLPYPHNALMAAILLGDQGGIPGCSAAETEAAEENGTVCAKLKEQFNISGLRHLTAVSGMHVAIMAAALMAIGLAAGLWRGQAFWFATAVIWLFIVMIGMPASAVRAGIMGTLMLFAQKIGRPADSSRIIVFAAAAMAVQNPMLPRFDIGFQLSFLAVMGMVYLSPFFRSRLKFLPGAGFFDLRSVLAQTFAAQIFTLPILIFNFGYVSLYAPIANILIVLFVPLITILGFLLAFSGLVFAPLAWFVSLPVWLFLEYLLRLAGSISQLPFAALFFNVAWPWLFVFYFFLAAAIFHLKRKQKTDFLTA